MMRTDNRGFTALIAVLLLAAGSLSISLASLAAAAQYADIVTRHELRIQRSLNERACADTLELMITKDFFLQGNIGIPEFGCTAEVTNGIITNLSVHFP